MIENMCKPVLKAFMFGKMVIKSYHLLSPAVRHEAVHIPDFGIETFQLLNEFFYVRLFKIQLAGIVLRNDLASEKLLPVFLFLQDKPIRKNHVSFIIKNQLKTEQIMIESSGSS